MQNLQSALGVIALIAFAWAISENRRAVSPRRVRSDFAIALVLAVLFLKVPPITARLRLGSITVDRRHRRGQPRRHRALCSAISAAARCRSS